jgi:LmbE family N-acetylglucosaminyl deacetylase
MKILAIGGHPDDVEQFAGGTLALLQEKGHEITIAAATRGECGSTTLSSEEIAKIRLEESEKAAKILGARFINVGLADGSVEYNLENTRKFVSLLREVQPDIIFTHPAKDDYMTDHWHTGALVMWAVPEAHHCNFKTQNDLPNLEGPVYVYQWDPQGLTTSDGQIAHVNTIVDISTVMEKKFKAFTAHASQIDFMPKSKDGLDTVGVTRRWSVIRGEQAGFVHGEGFMQVRHANYPKENILSQLLPDKVYTL